MANRRLIITFALVFALAFSLFYYVLFTTVDFVAFPHSNARCI